jgi:hypothetical protein
MKVLYSGHMTIVKYFLKEKFYEYKDFENPNGKRKYFYV